MHYLLLIMFLLLLQYTHLLMFGLILQGVLPWQWGKNTLNVRINHINLKLPYLRNSGEHGNLSDWYIFLIALDALNWLNYEAIDYNFIAIVWKSPASISMVKADQIVVR